MSADGWTFEVRPNEVDPNDRGAKQLPPGWYAQRSEDADSGEIAGPFATEPEARATLGGAA